MLSPSTWPPGVRGCLWMTGTLASFTAMGVGGRELSDTLSALQISFIRATGGFLIVTALLAQFGFAQARLRRLPLHLVRNTFHFASQSLWFYSLSILPLATVFALEFTIPIWSAILAVIFLAERMNRGRTVAVAMGFVGILVIVQPGTEIFDPASIIVVVAAIGFSVSNVCTKPLSRDHTPLAIIFYMNLIQMPLGLAAALWVGWVWPTSADLPWMIVVGASGLTAHFCMTRAFMLADATLVLPIDYLRLPLAALIGYLMYDESVDAALVLGALVILGGNLYSIRHEGRLHRLRAETAKGGA